MEQLVNFVIRPPRAEYDPANDLLDQEFTLKGKLYQRKDVEVTNNRGDILKCSHYVPVVSPGDKPLPCVIFCHGNSGCRVDASEAAIILLPSNITVFTLDFSGSGLSGGEYVTLGWNEKDDLKAVVDYLRADGNVSLIGLWGRSMGAVTSLMYGAEDPSIAGMVLDSPFSALVDLMMELVDTYKIRLPKFTVKFAIHYMRKAIQKKAKFDIMELNALKVAETCFVPVLLGHALDDDFIKPHHSDRIYETYVGDKNIIKFEGDHNSPRPQFYFDSINIFFHNVLQPPEDEVAGTYFDSMQDYFGKGGWSSVPELGFAREPSVPKGLGASSTSNAIRQPHSRPPKSPEDVEGDDESCASSSRMINFELSNGDPYGPHVPAVIDGDQYVEYELDDLRGFPCTAEEEEKMLMEAVMESLKDINMHHPQPEEPSHDSGSSSFESSQGGDQETSSTRELCDTSKTESNSTSLVNGHVSSPDMSPPSIAPSFGTPPSVLESETNGAPSPVDSSTNVPVPSTANGDILSTEVQGPPNSDADVSGSTKATLTVVKNPANHIMDGLMRRWDLNFFKGNR